jgi:pSer/pThr/pTyr-binding forkhead associated (FHA) protein/anti-anti-sigma regulatory factor
MATELVVLTAGPLQGQAIPIRFSEFPIGRGEGCVLRPASPLVGQRHCVLYLRGNRTLVRDFGTSSGTLVNGQRITAETELHDGDRLDVGPLAFTVRIRTPPPPAAVVVPPRPAPPPLPEPPQPKPDPPAAPAPPRAPAPRPAPETGRKLYLIPTKGKLRGVPVPVPGELFLIGTAQECQLRPPPSGVAPRHCLLYVRDKKDVVVRDLDSGELTFVNGKPLPGGSERPLQAGDVVALGAAEFLVKFKEPGESPRDLEGWALRSLDDDSTAGPRELTEEEQIFDDHGASHDAAQAAASILGALATHRRVADGPLRVRAHGGVTVVRFNDVNLTDEQDLVAVKKALDAELARPGPRVLLDFKVVREMSDEAVETVRAALQRVLRAGSRAALCRLHPSVRHHLERLQFKGFPKHFPDKNAALEAEW